MCYFGIVNPTGYLHNLNLSMTEGCLQHRQDRSLASGMPGTPALYMTQDTFTLSFTPWSNWAYGRRDQRNRRKPMPTWRTCRKTLKAHSKSYYFSPNVDVELCWFLSNINPLVISFFPHCSAVLFLWFKKQNANWHLIQRHTQFGQRHFDLLGSHLVASWCFEISHVKVLIDLFYSDVWY